MKALIVGAGSVGQLYGFCLANGGAEVDVYVRPKYAEDAAGGFALFDRKRGLSNPERFVPGAVLTSPDDLAGNDYDVVILCIPSTGLRGDWFEPFASALGDATLVSLSPALKDREFVGQFLPSESVGWGLITSVSYPAPLPGEEVSEPGTAYWFPPMAPAIFQGPSEGIDPLVSVLSKGGMASKRTSDVAEKAAFGSAVLMPTIAVMELKGWSFAAMRGDRAAMKLLHAGIQETLESVEHALGSTRPFPTRMLSPMILSGGTRMANMVSPFDMEVYLQVHFTKVGDQTRLFFHDYLEQRQAHDLESPALTEILEGLKTLDQADQSDK